MPGAAQCAGDGAQGPGALDALAALRRMQPLPQVIVALHVQPEIGTVAEHTRSSGQYRALIVAQFVEVLALHPYRVRKFALGQAEGSKLAEWLRPCSPV
jgi:hypothetical protein